MAASINTNVSSLNAQRNLSTSQTGLNTSLQRLSSGLRINSAKDDAAGLAISERFSSQIRGNNQAARNANDGISLAQTAEGGLSTAGDLLQRVRELAVQSANGSNSTSDRASIQGEVSALTQELNRVANTTQFNGQNVLDGTLTNSQFQVGANSGQTINIGVSSAKSTDIGNNVISTASTNGAGINAATTGTGANGFTAQNLTVNGNGTSTDSPPGTPAAALTFAAGTSAKAIASGVNTFSSTTGVTATASTTATINGVVGQGAVSFTLKGSNSTALTINATTSNNQDLTAIAQAVNAQSGTTGITAVADKNGGLSLVESSGADIQITNGANSAISFNLSGTDTAGGATAVAVNVAAGAEGTVGGKVEFNSAAGFSVNTTGDTSLLASTTNGSNLNTVAAIDVSTTAGANEAIKTVDAALTSINSNRAALGAIQNRFASTISNLQTTTENMSASRSRIQDTDFASETASLTRGQILQQAGTAMLAQANSLPNGVLALLRG